MLQTKSNNFNIVTLFRGLKVGCTSVRDSLYREVVVLAPNYPYRSLFSIQLVFLILGKFEWHVGGLGNTFLT